MNEAHVESVSAPSAAPGPAHGVPPPRAAVAPVVGLGGSAGALRALQRFLEEMPADTGMAFVVILHLSAEHESALAQILQRSTRMPVVQVQARLHAEPNRVYVIPPGKNLSYTEGDLILTELPSERIRRAPVDLFFRALADTHGPQAMAIVLSGSDSDGSSGIKRIKERGGLTLAQDPAEAEFDGMPRSAIGTGMVDWVLPVQAMPERLLQYQKNRYHIQLPADAEPPPPEEPSADAEAALRGVLTFLRTRTGRDFSGYKRATLLRRLSRRLQVNGVPDLPSYQRFLNAHAGEAGALLQDLLISVTNFFRDRESFEALERAIPQLFRDKGPDEVVRVWVPGCATGEEAYSIAMLLREHASTLVAPPQVQIFATDLDETAIQLARSGTYPETIAADVSEERLRRYFVRQHGHYRAHASLRENILFAVHDVLKDAPFSRLDLISCRNLLIYLNRPAQARAFDVFHFALRPEGRLFLGSSETADDASPLFAALDKKNRLYVRRATARPAFPLTSGPLSLGLTLPLVSMPPERSASPVDPAAAGAGLLARVAGPALAMPELHYQLIEALAPPSLVINRAQQIVHLSSRVGRFLRLTGGEPTNELLALAQPSMRAELRAGLFQALENNTPVELRGLVAEIDATHHTVNVLIRPAPELGGECLLVVFDDQGEASAATAARPLAAREDVIHHLERELELLKHQLRSSTEQHTATAEEMKASNEELQAMNEELRSASEELETSREEMQAINEELITVNAELKSKLDELSRSNSDLKNLMAATNIATVFLDEELRIQRYTPPAVALFSLIPTDTGRPLSDLSHRFEFASIVTDAERVLTDLTVCEHELRSRDGHWYLTRISPYRGADQRRGGVILTFVDITGRKRAEEAVVESEARFRAIVGQTAAGVALIDLQGRLLFLNPTLAQLAGQPAGEPAGGSFLDWLHPDERAEASERLQRLAEDGGPFRTEVRLRQAEGAWLWINLSVSAIAGAGGAPASAVAVVVEVHERRAATEALRESEARLRALVNQTTVGIVQLDTQGRVVYANDQFWAATGAEPAGRRPDAGLAGLVHPADRAALADQLAGLWRERRGFATEARWRRPDGSDVWLMGNASPILDAAGRIAGATVSLVDISDRKHGEQELVAVKDELAANLQAMMRLHELSKRLVASAELPVLLEEVLDAAIAIRGADFGFIQLRHPRSGRLHIVSQRGFAEDFLARFGDVAVDDAHDWGRALREGRQIQLTDVQDAAVPAQTRELAAAAGYRAMQATPLFDRAGEPLGILSTHFRQPHESNERDLRLAELYARQAAEIIGWKLAEDNLRHWIERVQVAIDLAGLGFWDWDLQRDVVEWEPRHNRLMGLPLDAQEGTLAEVLERVHPEDRELLNDALRAALEHSDHFEVEFRTRWPDGSEHRINGQGRVLRDGAGHARRMVGAVLDVTERHESEQLLREHKQELEQALAAANVADEAKNRFLATLSHELRTPLNPVLLLATEAAVDPALAAPLRQKFELMRRNIELEARLIDDLLDLTLITRGQMTLERSVVDAHTVLRDALRTVAADFAPKRIVPTVELAAERAAVQADPARLQQVFWNILRNAAKFSPLGGALRVETSNPTADRFAVHITDHGIGMSEAELARVFQPFTQGDHAAIPATSRFGGLGLGLSISRQLTEMLGGRISASSAGTGRGCTFTVELPLVEQTVAAAPVAGTRPEAPPPGLRVLVVEDHADTRAALVHLLKRKGYEPGAAGSVAQALQQLASASWDLVISDVGLPDGDGYDLMTQCRQRHPDLPGIALSGYGSDADVARSRQAGFAEHLVKPVSMARLQAALGRVLGGADPRAAPSQGPDAPG